MNITLNAELFQTNVFQKSFQEKLKSARYWDYSDRLSSLTDLELKHYEYARAVKGVLAEFCFMGYLVEMGIDFVYNKKVDDRKYSVDIDFYIPSLNKRIDIKSGFSYWKKSALVKHGIDYVVVCSPMLEHKKAMYRKGGWLLCKSYRQLFKEDITITLSGYISTEDALNQGPTYNLSSIENLFK